MGLAQGYISGFVSDGGNPPGPNVETTDATTVMWTQLIIGPQTTNVWSPAVAIPFPFEFFGNPVTQLKASQNGLITFATSTTVLPGDNDPMPSTQLPDSTIAVLWDAFTNAAPTGGGDNIIYQTFGTAPNRQFWVKWYSFEIGNPSNGFSYFACVLEESSNAIYVVDQYSGASTSSRSVGLQLNTSTFLEATNSYTVPSNGAAPPDNDYWFFLPQSNGTDIRVSDVSFSDAAESGCGGAAEPVTIEIVNIGTNPVSNPVGTFSVNGAVPGFFEIIPATLQPGDTVNYTFATNFADLSAPGTAAITGVATTPGDVNINNDSLTVGVTTIAPLALPLPVVDFVGFNSSNLPTITNTLWYEAVGEFAPDSGTSNWNSDNFGNNAASPNGTAASINIWLAAKDDWLVGPKILCQSNTALSYDLALTQFGSTTATTLGSDDIFEVRVSSDCGVTWTAIQSFDVTSTISAVGQVETVPLGAFAGQEIIVGFFASEGAIDDLPDNELFLDNIFFYNQPPVDVGVSDILQPAGAFCGTAAGQGEVEITNYGSQPVAFSTANPLLVTMVLSGANTGNYLYQQTSGSLPPGGSVTLPISTTLNLTNDGLTNVAAFTTLAGDGLAVNDSSFTSVDIDGSAPTPLSLLPVDFTGFNGGNLPAITNNLWYEAFGAMIPDSGFASFVSGDFANDPANPNGTAASINLWLASKRDWIVGPKVVPQPNTVITYDLALTQFGGTIPGTLGSDDQVQVLVSTDCGGTWTALQTFDATTPISNTGQTEILSLAAYTGQEVRVAFFATEGAIDDPEDNQIFLDNIQVFNVPDVDLRVASLVGPTSGCLSSGADSVFASVINSGVLPVDFSVDPATFNLTVSGPLPQTFSTPQTTGVFSPGDTIELLYLVNFAQGGTYNLELVSTLAPDSLATNDTATTVVESGAYTAPYYENFDAFPVLTSTLPLTWAVEANGAFGYRWQGEDGPTGSTNTGPGVDHTTGALGGIYLYAEASSGLLGDTTRLTSPCIDLGTLTLPRLEFWYHMYGVNIGSFYFYVQDASGTLTQEFFAVGQQDSAEAPLDPWNQVVVDLTPYAGQVINLVFEAVRGPNFTGDMAIDDVLIYEPTGIDMGAVAIDAPSSACFLTPQSIGATITNFELIPLDLVTNPVTVTLDITGPTPQTFSTTLNTGVLNSGGSLTLNITNLADLTVGGVYTATVYTTVTNDAIPFNDTISTEIISLPLFTPVYTEDFESFTPDGLFSGTGGGLDFDWINTPSGPTTTFNWSVGNDNTGSGATGPDVDHTLGTPAGVYMYTEGNFGTLGDTARLLSTCIDLVGTTDPVLEFWYHMHGSGMGTLAVNVIDNQGNSTQVWSLSGQQQGDEIEPWQFGFVNLGSFQNDTVRLEFIGVRGSSTLTDMAIDDIYVGPPTRTDLAAFDILSPLSPGCLDASMDLTVQVQSQGQEVDFSNNTLFITADITGPNPVNFIDSVNTGVLGVGSSLNVTLTNALNFGTAGTYTITYAIQFADDTVAVNDTLVLTYLKEPVVTTPIGPVEFNGYTGANLPTAYPGWNEGVGVGTAQIGVNSPGWVSDDFANVIGGPNGTAARINLAFLGDDDWIISPPFVAGNLDLLSFDLALTTGFGTGAGTLGVDDKLQILVTADCGLSYTLVREYDNNSVISNLGQQEFVNLSGFSGQEIRVAFYATEGLIDDPISVDLFLDNILIDAGAAKNANMLARLSPTTESCGDSLTMGEFEIQNLGVDTMVNLPLLITIDGPNGQVLFNDIFPGPLALGETGIHMFGPFDTYEGGTYIIEGIALLVGDTLNANDTLLDTLNILNASPPRVLAYGSYCPGDSLMLIADTAETVDFLWYDVPTGGTPIATGDTFVTPVLPGVPTSYYLEVSDPSFTVGPVDNTIGAGGIFAPISLGVQGLLVDVQQPFLLDSVAVYTDGPGDVVVQVLDQATGAVVAASTPVFVPTGGVKTFIPVGLAITPGSYEFNAEGGTTGLFRNTAGGSYPYSVPGVLSITGNTFNPNYYYYFYDWHISSNACDRPRREIALTPDLPVADFAVDSLGDLYLALTNQATNFDSVVYDFGDGTTSSFLNPVHTYTDSGTYVVCQIAFNDCGPDTSCQQVSIICAPASGGFSLASTGDLTASFTDESTKADSVVYDFGDGSALSNDPSPTHIYADTGSYTVTQIAYHFCGNDTTTLQVTITCAFAVADFQFTIQANGLTIDLTSLATNADSVIYDMGDGTILTNMPNTTYTYPAAGSYDICMQVFNDCGVDELCQNLAVTSVNVIQGGSLQLFPNPSQGQVTLEMTVRQASNLEVDMVDASGRTVLHQAFGQVSGAFTHRFALDGLSEGVYLVKILVDDQLIMRKLQVE
jgi:PKD repeat protein